MPLSRLFQRHIMRVYMTSNSKLWHILSSDGVLLKNVTWTLSNQMFHDLNGNKDNFHPPTKSIKQQAFSAFHCFISGVNAAYANWQFGNKGWFFHYFVKLISRKIFSVSMTKLFICCSVWVVTASCRLIDCSLKQTARTKSFKQHQIC